MRQSLKHAAGWALGLVLALPALGQAQSLEERLRTQLRNTAQRLQQVQSQQAQITAAKTTAEAERDAAQRELTALRSEVEGLRTRAARLLDEQTALRRQALAQTANNHDQMQQAQKAQTAYQALERQATTWQSESSSLKAKLSGRDGQYQLCVAKNQALYQAGRELLTAYEAFGTADLLALRQPFSGSGRVLFDEKAQTFGDRLYQGQVDAGTPPDAPIAKQ